MAKKTIYVPDADLDVFEQAKKYAGESMSAVIVQGLKDFVKSKEKELHGYEEVVLFEGKMHTGVQVGRNVKFMGKLLAEDYRDRVQGFTSATRHYYKIYLTFKGAFVLYQQIDSPKNVEDIYKFDTYQNMEELLKQDLPPNLLREATSNLPEVVCEELDI